MLFKFNFMVRKSRHKFVFLVFIRFKVIYDVNQIYLVTHFYNVTVACNDIYVLFFLSQFHMMPEITVWKKNIYDALLHDNTQKVYYLQFESM